MHFQILSHAGLLIQSSGKTLLFDPWILGSAYWRSWWNYPPVSRQIWENLQPDYIALTHIHWDHFHGDSLKKFSRNTTFLIPKGHFERMKKDLEYLGFSNIIEIGHGKRIELAQDFYLTAYQFYPFMDSGAIIEAEGVKLFNANDAKFMGKPLNQILKQHPKIDFVFRSHSSANPRICFDYFDAPIRPSEKPDAYLRNFAAFVSTVGARYAIPFASNHCFLHREVFHLNHTIVTPVQVADYFQAQGIMGPEVKVMVSGDRWSSSHGFAIADSAFFQNRDQKLLAYAAEQTKVLEHFYALEAKAEVKLNQVEEYFRVFISCMPWLVRRYFKNHPITFVLTGQRTFRFWVDIFKGTVREVGPVNDSHHPLQIHTSAYIFRRCMALNLFHSLGISKRVLYRCHQKNAKYLWLLELLFNFYEYGMLPWQKLLSLKFIRVWMPRWREILLYATILFRKGMGRNFVMEDYLGPVIYNLTGKGRLRELVFSLEAKAVKSQL